MTEQSQALTAVYLLSLYGKWQKLNFIDTMKKFIGDGPHRSPFSILSVFGFYILSTFCMVKFLRREFRRDD
jgi:hypothetical protein